MSYIDTPDDTVLPVGEASHVDAQHANQPVMDAFAIQQKARSLTLNVPTDDRLVREHLRAYGEPICLFGEDPYERRERLRLLVARATLKGGEPHVSSLGKPAVTTVETLTENELFYTEGPPTLRPIRQRITEISLPAAHKRLKTIAHLQQNVSKEAFYASYQSYHSHLMHHLDLTASQVADDRPLTDGQFLADNETFATSSWTGLIKLWDTRTCALKKTLRGHKDRIYGLGCSKTEGEGVCLASAGAEGCVHVWDDTISTPVHTLVGHEDRVNQVAFHPYGPYLGSTSHDETWRFWDLNTQTELYFQEGHKSAVLPIKFHPDGALVLTGDVNGLILLWDLRLGKHIATLKEHVKLVYTLDFDPFFPHHVASGSEDHTVRIWDLRCVSCAHTVLAHSKRVSQCLYEPRYGRYLFTTSYDGTASFWSPVDYSLVYSLPAQEARIMAAAISPYGDRLSLLSFDRTWKLWQLTTPYEKELRDDFLD